MTTQSVCLLKNEKKKRVFGIVSIKLEATDLKEVNAVCLTLTETDKENATIDASTSSPTQWTSHTMAARG